MKRFLGMMLVATVVLALGPFVSGCDAENANIRKALVARGFSEAVAGQLSTLGLEQHEVENLGVAREQGYDEKLLLSMTESLHERGADFQIGEELRLFKGQGMSGETIAALVDMGAIPGWSDDARALKDAGVGEDAIIDIARVRFVDKKPVIAGIDLVPLKTVGMSDAGLVRFVQRGGDLNMREKVAREIALGKPEDDALSAAGL